MRDANQASVAAVARERRVLGVVLMISASLSVPVVDGIAKYLTTDHSPFFVAWARYAFASLFVLPVLSIRHRDTWWPRAGLATHLLRTTFIASATTCFFFAIATIPLATALGGFFVDPVIASLLAVPVLREPPTRVKMVAAWAGLLGALLIVQPGFDSRPGSLLALASGAFLACYLVATRRAAQADPPLVTLAWQCGLGALPDAVRSLALVVAVQRGSAVHWAGGNRPDSRWRHRSSEATPPKGWHQAIRVAISPWEWCMLGMHDRNWLAARVRDLIDPSTLGMTDQQLEASGVAKRRRDDMTERRTRRERRALPPLSRRSARPHPYIEPRLRACFVPPLRWMEQRRQIFDFLGDKAIPRRASPPAAHWKKLRKALDAKASKARQELEQRERNLRQGGSAEKKAVSPHYLEELAQRIEALGDLPRWRVQWLVSLHAEALTEEALIGDLEVLNRRRAGLELEVYEFEAVDPEGPLKLINEHARVRYDASPPGSSPRGS